MPPLYQLTEQALLGLPRDLRRCVWDFILPAPPDTRIIVELDMNGFSRAIQAVVLPRWRIGWTPSEMFKRARRWPVFDENTCVHKGKWIYWVGWSTLCWLNPKLAANWSCRLMTLQDLHDHLRVRSSLWRCCHPTFDDLIRSHSHFPSAASVVCACIFHRHMRCKHGVQIPIISVQ